MSTVIGSAPYDFVAQRYHLPVVIAALTALSWVQMVGPADGPQLAPCCGARFDVTFAMWIVMMVGAS